MGIITSLTRCGVPISSLRRSKDLIAEEVIGPSVDMSTDMMSTFLRRLMGSNASASVMTRGGLPFTFKMLPGSGGVVVIPM